MSGMIFSSAGIKRRNIIWRQLRESYLSGFLLSSGNFLGDSCSRVIISGQLFSGGIL